MGRPVASVSPSQSPRGPCGVQGAAGYATACKAWGPAGPPTPPPGQYPLLAPLGSQGQAQASWGSPRPLPAPHRAPQPRPTSRPGTPLGDQLLWKSEKSPNKEVGLYVPGSYQLINGPLFKGLISLGPTDEGWRHLSCRLVRPSRAGSI